MVGIISKKERFINNGKNIGKRNETTIQEQAELELHSLYQKQLDQGYVFDLGEVWSQLGSGGCYNWQGLSLRLIKN